MASYLDEILAHHRQRAQADTRSLDALMELARAEVPPPRGFRAAIERAQGLSIVAEIKRRSPSKGPLDADLIAPSLAQAYEAGGATCISVLTDAKFFAGSVEDFDLARNAVALPGLRKDFTVDARDVCDTRIMDGDAVLLIVAALDVGQLREFHELTIELGMDALVEVHDEDELQIALDVGATLIGVNQRDLTTFEVDTERAQRVCSAIPDGVITVAESGIRDVDDTRRLRDAGFDAVLVGEALVTAEDPLLAVAALRPR
ncbi:MAG: indole-3-glycerol phosphate synthase TrpC [Acidimicrobiia bacterium]|nr:indole-3-glycerol phosphate synthase TrpC [Acidimicrobiia bacterium]MBA3981965.1 indole-3-glycerol phosphate synthase TrpC [Acidimicrobiia bacterium]MDQ3392149.1 indole-3-glycerol phosphate synthase TrpC [Actinomycetota bacterium]